MKILIVHNFYQTRGGEDVVVEAEGRLLRERGHEVEFFTVRNDDIDTWWKKAWVGLFTIYNPWAAARLTGKLRSCRPDVVHVHNFFPQLSPSIFRACHAAGVPVVMTLHNFRILCPTAFLFHDDKLREQSLKRSAFWTVRYATYRGSKAATAVVAAMVDIHKWIGTWRRDVDRFIALTEFAKEKFIEGGLPADRIVVKGNALADPKATAAWIDGPRRGALYVGRLGPEKGIANLLEAWKGFDYPLRIVGDGPLREECERAQSEHITYLGRMTQHEVYAEMRRAAFLVMPSVWYEMFPMTLVEAFANELPVLASRLGALRSLLDEGITGLAFDPTLPADLRATAERAIADPEKLAEMGAHGRVLYENLYSTDINYLKLMRTYAMVIESFSRGAFAAPDDMTTIGFGGM
ncbi:MAG: glycosyltransferase [Alphaproteobacteria bacterium]|nr:glycosyltransferase [Alphaproteobacteria bacterium]